MHKRRYKGYDYEAHSHPDLPPKPEAGPSPGRGQIQLWLHKGGGWYFNPVTGEKRQGKPRA